MGFTGTKRRVYYYAIALNDEGNIGIMLVIRNGGKQVSDEWTGETFPNTRKGQDAANALMIYRNCL